MAETETDPAIDIDAAQAEADVAADPTPPTLEDIASEMGWSPEDKWRGPKDKWRDAATFLKTTVEVNRSLSKEVKGLKDTTERMARVTESVIARTRAEAYAEAEAKFNKAVEDGDPVAARRASENLAAIREEGRETSSEASFASRNPWYGKDEDATAYAVSISQREAGKGKSHEQQLEAVEEGVRKRFPELFDDASPPARKAPPGVAAPTSRSAAPSRAKGVADLPPDARAAAARFVKAGAFKTEADYAKAYFEENA